MLNFSGIKWGSLGDPKGGKFVDVQPSFDLGDAFENTKLDVLTKSAVFSSY